MEAITKENSFLDLSKLSEEQINRLYGKMNKCDEPIYYQERAFLTKGKFEKGLPYFHFHTGYNQWISSAILVMKQELTYTQFIEIMGGETSADISILERTEYPGKDYQELFDYLHNEHGLTLLESEMSEIINLVGKLGGESKEVLQVEHNGWISVENKLPSEEGEYLIYKENDPIEVKYYDLKQWGYYHSADEPPTHWMPLPEPPKF